MGIVPGNQVPDCEEICLFGNNRLQPQSFDLRKRDRLPVGDMNEPGKSAHVYFSNNPHEVCGAIMDRDLKRQDTVYSASVEDIVKAGWVPVFAPTTNLPLHVRLVPTEYVGDPVQPKMSIRKRLTETFSRKKIRR